MTIAGQYGETKLARIRIEEEEEPHHLILYPHNPTIWQFEGAVSRITHATVIPGLMVRKGQEAAGAGTIGLPKEKAEFLRAGSCDLAERDDSLSCV